MRLTQSRLSYGNPEGGGSAAGAGVGQGQGHDARRGAAGAAVEGRDIDDVQQRAGEDVGGALQLHGKAGVEHVRAGHALMHEAGFIPHIFGNPCEEGDHIMLGNSFNGINGRDINGRVGRPPIPERLGR